MFSENVTFISLSKSSDLRERKSKNLNNNPRMYLTSLGRYLCQYIIR